MRKQTNRLASYIRWDDPTRQIYLCGRRRKAAIKAATAHPMASLHGRDRVNLWLRSVMHDDMQTATTCLQAGRVPRLRSAQAQLFNYFVELLQDAN